MQVGKISIVFVGSMWPRRCGFGKIYVWQKSQLLAGHFLVKQHFVKDFGFCKNVVTWGFFFLDFWPIKLTLWKSFGESSCDFFWTVGDLVANSWIHKIWLRIFRYKHEMNETLHPWKLTAGSPKHHPALKSGKNHLSHPDLHFFGFKMLIFQVFMRAWKQERRFFFFPGSLRNEWSYKWQFQNFASGFWAALVDGVDIHPTKFNIATKNDGWKTSLSFWEGKISGDFMGVYRISLSGNIAQAFFLVPKWLAAIKPGIRKHPSSKNHHWLGLF